MAFFEGNKMTAGYGDGPDIITSWRNAYMRDELVLASRVKSLIEFYGLCIDFILACFNNFSGIVTLPSLSKFKLMLSERTEVAK